MSEDFRPGSPTSTALVQARLRTHLSDGSSSSSSLRNPLHSLTHRSAPRPVSRQLRFHVVQCRALDEAAKKKGVVLSGNRPIVVSIALLPAQKATPKREQLQESSPPSERPSHGSLFWDFRGTMQCQTEHTEIVVSIIDRSGIRSKTLANLYVPVSFVPDREAGLMGWFDLMPPTKSLGGTKRSPLARSEAGQPSCGFGQVQIELAMVEVSSTQPGVALSYVASDTNIEEVDDVTPRSASPPVSEAAEDKVDQTTRSASIDTTAVAPNEEKSLVLSKMPPLPPNPSSISPDSQTPKGSHSRKNTLDSVALPNAAANPIHEARQSRQNVAAKVSQLIQYLDRFKPARSAISLLPPELTVATGRMGRCVVTVIEGRDLPDTTSMFRRSNSVDSYVVVQTGGHWWKTSTCIRTSDPVWNTAFEFDIEDLSHEIRLLVFDGRDEFLGQTSICVGALPPLARRDMEVWLPLRMRSEINSPESHTPASLQGYLLVRFRWHCEDLLAAALNHLALVESDTGANKIYPGDREEKVRKLEKAGIPARAYDLVHQGRRKPKMDGTLVRNSLFVMQEAVLGPAMALYTYVNKVRGWENPGLTMVWLVGYMIFCHHPATCVRWFPLLLAVFIVQRRKRETDFSDERAPERLPHSRKPVEEEPTAVESEDAVARGLEGSTGSVVSARSSGSEAGKVSGDGKSGNGPGLFDRLKQVRSGMGTMDAGLSSYYASYTRLCNVFNWSSPLGTGCFCAGLVAVWLAMMLTTVRTVFILFGLVFFLVPSGKLRQRSGAVTRFIQRVPPVRRTLRLEDRMLRGDAPTGPATSST